MRVTYEDVSGGETIISVTYSRRRWWLCGPVIEWTDRYRGDSTVWHVYPSGERCGTMTESWLCDLWTVHQWAKADKRRGK